jgi:hypothetical protein
MLLLTFSVVDVRFLYIFESVEGMKKLCSRDTSAYALDMKSGVIRRL